MRAAVATKDGLQVRRSQSRVRKPNEIFGQVRAASGSCCRSCELALAARQFTGTPSGHPYRSGGGRGEPRCKPD